MLINNNSFFLDEKKLSGENGFSILEILIAISIFAIGLLAVANLLITASSSNRVGNAYSTATMLAQMQTETLKIADFGSPALTAGAYADPNNPINERGQNGGIFTRTWTIVNNTPFSQLINVTVAWNNRTVVMSTITRGGGT
ncbi:MAG: type II secretion system protein [Deltaproteobacteria bacterium]|nr:type II secretion system protein [Deltaproteobacteria bacterium]